MRGDQDEGAQTERISRHRGLGSVRARARHRRRTTCSEPSRRKIGRRVSRFLRRRAVGTRRDARRRGVRVGRPRGETPADHASVQRVTRRRALALPEHGRARHRARGTKGRVPVGEQSDVRAGRVGGFRESRRRRGERDGRGGGGGGRTSETSRGRERGGGDCARRARAEAGRRRREGRRRGGEIRRRRRREIRSRRRRRARGAGSGDDGAPPAHAVDGATQPRDHPRAKQTRRAAGETRGGAVFPSHRRGARTREGVRRLPGKRRRRRRRGPGV